MTVDQHIEVTVLSGLSGAGRSEAAKVLEDLGWYVIDNLPPQLLEQMIALALSPGTLISRIALVVDARGGTFFLEALGALDALKEQVDYRLVFLEASDEVLVRRFDATHRRHPLVTDNVETGVKEERELMMPFRSRADLIIDTSDMNPRDLRLKIAAHFGAADPSDGLKTTVVSFGYKNGLPVDADIVLDVRFLPNPHWIDELRPFDGRDEKIKRFVLEQDATEAFLERAKSLFDLLMPGYREEGRHYLTVAIGCTGGRHRSVVLAQCLADYFNEAGYATKVLHRDVDRSRLGSE